MKKESILLIGVLLSLILLAAFGLLQIVDSKLLQLPSQWLAIAILPIIIALFVGGFITRFKGFGVELETALKTPVANLNLTASDAVADIPGDEKQSIMYLQDLPYEKKQATRWLLFKSGRQNYYRANDIEMYMKELPNLQYFEIRSEGGDFICFLPTSAFRNTTHYRNEIDYDKLKKFIKAIEENNVPSAFSGLAISLAISSERELIDVLKVMRAEKADFAAVISPSGQYLGVVFANEVEKKIADSVLATQTV